MSRVGHLVRCTGTRIRKFNPGTEGCIVFRWFVVHVVLIFICGLITCWTSTSMADQIFLHNHALEMTSSDSLKGHLLLFDCPSCNGGVDWREPRPGYEGIQTEQGPPVDLNVRLDAP